MKVSYKKLWKLLIDMEINKRTLAGMANISTSTLTKLAKGESVNMEMLVRICSAIKCDLHDIVEIVPNEADGDEIEKPNGGNGNE
ncbi:transcriptional regulator [Clostridia bacterium]|nr:transcriptional regulator [Clostridia bacterium]